MLVKANSSCWRAVLMGCPSVEALTTMGGY